MGTDSRPIVGAIDVSILIPGLTLIRKPLETYLIVRESDGDRELTAAEWQALLLLAFAGHPASPTPPSLDCPPGQGGR